MTKKRLPLLQGTLDLLVLKALTSGPLHGYGVVRRIEEATQSVIFVEEGSLYPALHRLAKRGWIEPEWGRSENNRPAKFYRLTASGRKQMRAEERDWIRFRDAVQQLLDIEPAKG